MKKKVISAILCGAMVLGTVCPVLAADDKSEDTKTEAAGNSAEAKRSLWLVKQRATHSSRSQLNLSRRQ